jgi:diguanylate cyclase (GGDEF)-like protein
MVDSREPTQRILIVDDEPRNIAVLAEILKSEYKTVAAKSGPQALSRAQSDMPPDLILLDIMMPEMDGYEVCKRLKADDRTKNIPVIFVTAMSEIDDEMKGFELGAVDYITKPVQPALVRARAKTHLGLKRKTDLLERLVSIDGLTEIPNRRRFDEIVDLEWRRAQRDGQPITLMLMDIDYFKRFNDNYGHALGDECLRAVAGTLQTTLKRPADFVARYGGEEFAAVLPELNGKDAAVVAERLRDAVQGLYIRHDNSHVSAYVTLSIGVATTIPSTSSSHQELIESADTMLYHAKNSGRNQIAIVELG